jgi:hypothetical protein
MELVGLDEAGSREDPKAVRGMDELELTIGPPGAALENEDPSPAASAAPRPDVDVSALLRDVLAHV